MMVRVALCVPETACMQGWRQAVLLGFSYGASLVIRLAAEHPESTSGVVCIGVGFGKPVKQLTAAR